MAPRQRICLMDRKQVFLGEDGEHGGGVRVTPGGARGLLLALYLGVAPKGPWDHVMLGFNRGRCTQGKSVMPVILSLA